MVFIKGDRLIDAPSFFDDWSNLSFTNNPVSEWLYGDWTREKYHEFLALRSIRPIGLYFDYLLDSRNTEKYLDRYGMDYGAIYDPRNLPNASSGTALAGYGVNFVSKNINKLYR